MNEKQRKNYTPDNCGHSVGCHETRPDTRPIPVAEGWAGAEMRVFTLSNSITMTDELTDGSTDEPMEGKSLLKICVSATKKEKKENQKKMRMV